MGKVQLEQLLFSLSRNSGSMSISPRGTSVGPELRHGRHSNDRKREPSGWHAVEGFSAMVARLLLTPVQKSLQFFVGLLENPLISKKVKV